MGKKENKKKGRSVRLEVYGDNCSSGLLVRGYVCRLYSYSVSIPR